MDVCPFLKRIGRRGNFRVEIESERRGGSSLVVEFNGNVEERLSLKAAARFPGGEWSGHEFQLGYCPGRSSDMNINGLC